MSPRALVPVVLAAGLVVVVLLLGFFGVGPAGRDLSRSAAVARLEVERTESRLEGLAGPAFAADLEAARHGVRRERDRVRAELRRAAEGLSIWFPDAAAAGAVPEPERFTERYAFHRDELIRRLDAACAAAGVVADPSVPIAVSLAPFAAERRSPNPSEMSQAQRLFHLESRLLGAAARHGARPVRPLEWTPGWREYDRRGERFLEEKVVLHLAVPALRLRAVPRALLSLEGGPVTRILGLALEDRPLPKDLPEEGEAAVSLRVALAVVFYQGPAGGD